MLWWGGVFALFVGLGYWVTRRDWRFGIPIVGVLTTWLPWFRYDDRPIFFYYARRDHPVHGDRRDAGARQDPGPRRCEPHRRKVVGVIAVGGLRRRWSG